MNINSRINVHLTYSKLLLNRPVHQSVTTNCHENMHGDKIANINSHENMVIDFYKRINSDTEAIKYRSL